MNIKKNYQGGTPYKVKVLADMVLALTLMLQGAVPSMPITANQQVWVMLLLSGIGIIFKFATKFFTNDGQETENMDKAADSNSDGGNA